MAEQQTYATHHRYIPEFHFFVLPVLVANIVVTVIEFVRHPGFITAWIAIVAIALASASGRRGRWRSELSIASSVWRSVCVSLSSCHRICAAGLVSFKRAN